MSAAGVKLHEANAAFQQAARDEALAAEVGGARLIETVHGTRRWALAVEIDGLGGGRLHAESQFVRLDAGGQL